VVAVVLALSACSSGRPEPFEMTERQPEYPEALASTVAIAPADMAVPVEGGPRALAFVTNEFYISFLTFAEGTATVEPGMVLDRVKASGDEAMDLFRGFQAARMRDDELDASSCARLYPLIEERYLLLVWIDESATTGLRGNPSQDLAQDVDFAQDVYDVTYRTYEGKMTAEVVDLVVAKTLWKGSINYETGEMYADNEPSDLWTRRSEAALALARMMTLH